MPSEKNIAVVFYLSRQNRYSFNALAGAAEEVLTVPAFNVYLFRQKEHLLKVMNQLKEKHHRIILCLSFFTTQIWHFRELIQHLKERHSRSLIIIAGGPHPTGKPEEVLRMGADIVVRAEAEITFPRLLTAILKKESFSDIKGITFLSSNQEYFTGWPDPVEIDRFPPVSFRFKLIGPIEITRGCPFKCYYCQTPYIFRGGIRHRSVEKILHYVKKLKERGIKDFRFISPNALSYGSTDGKTLNLQALDYLLKELRRTVSDNGRIYFGTFPSEVRPEHITEETIALIKKYCDNRTLIIGAQSGSQRVLDLCHRGHTVEDVIKAVKIATGAGFRVDVDFIFGLPAETEEDQQDTAAVMQELAALGARIHAHTFMPLPQTPFKNTWPAPLSKRLMKTINKLLPEGKLYGQWLQQREFIQKYRAGV